MDDRPLKLKELAKALGWSQETVQAWRAAGLPGHVVGHSEIYFMSEVVAWLKKQPAVLPPKKHRRRR